jgi:hypothetical protein
MKSKSRSRATHCLPALIAWALVACTPVQPEQSAHGMPDQPAAGAAASKAVTTFGGELTYMADAAQFTDCRTGHRYPVAMEADWITTERAYLKDVKEPGGRLYVTFEGSIAQRPRMEGNGTEPSVVVQRFIGTWPGRRCE